MPLRRVLFRAIAPYASAHPSGLATLCLHLEADGKDQWREQHPLTISSPKRLKS